MSDRLRISNTWGKRFTDQKIALPALLRHAGLPVGLFEQEKIYLTTAQLFALWRSVGETSSDPAIGLKLGSETRLARSHPAGIALRLFPEHQKSTQRHPAANLRIIGSAGILSPKWWLLFWNK